MGDKGARKIIADNPEKVALVSFPEGMIDIDTVSDYELLKKENDN
jgi:CTP:molybdopterin cytidylyltransferase MocA